MTATLPAVQYLHINRDAEFSVYFQNEDGTAIDQTGRQYTFKIYTKPGTVLLTVTWGAGVARGGGGGGGSGAIVRFDCPAFILPDQLFVQVGIGGAGGAATIKGRAAEAGTGVVTDLTPEQASVVLNAYARVIAGPACLP